MASTTMTIFGATDDLAARLLFPALYRLECGDRLDAHRWRPLRR
jgi:glucose-6-phosphate 1-dehydrogenase